MIVCLTAPDDEPPARVDPAVSTLPSEVATECGYTVWRQNTERPHAKTEIALVMVQPDAPFGLAAEIEINQINYFCDRKRFFENR